MREQCHTQTQTGSLAHGGGIVHDHGFGERGRNLLALAVPEHPIVGRCALLYINDRATVLRKLTKFLNPGGIVVLLEPDLSQIAEVPPSDLFTKARGWTLEGFAAGGADLDMGSKLYSTFMQAGLPVPNLIASQVVCGPTRFIVAWTHLA